MTLVESVLSGNRLSLSRLLTQVENQSPEGKAALRELFAHTGRAHLVGVTGAPGTGKSSLVNQLARCYRHPIDGGAPVKVAVIAVDPSSPFTGGAILGDRIRMRDLAGDPGIFIRSMASRGSLGGLASTTAALAQVFDAAGYEIVIIETVGAGQAEVDIAGLAHTTLVVEAPGLGDDIQAIKAGILEIADILVVNKADRPGVENTERALRNMLELAHPTRRVFRHHGRIMAVMPWENSPDPQPSESQPSQPEAFWQPVIQRTISTEGVGICDLAGLINRHREYLQKSGDWQRRERARLQAELQTHIQENLLENWRNSLPDEDYHTALDEVVSRRISPQEAAARLLKGR
jgi:LAO/AO transport system kinase